jgi:hypothetical protein
MRRTQSLLPRLYLTATSHTRLAWHTASDIDHADRFQVSCISSRLLRCRMFSRVSTRDGGAAAASCRADYLYSVACCGHAVNNAATIAVSVDDGQAVTPWCRARC